MDPYAGVLYVSHTGERGEQIRTVDTTSHEVTGTIDVAARGITVDPTTGTVYALAEDSSAGQSTMVAVIDPVDRRVVRRIEVGADATSGLTVDPVRGLLLVSDHDAGRLLVVDPAAGAVERTIQVVGVVGRSLRNCLGSIGTPVVDLTTGLATCPGILTPPWKPNPAQARGPPLERSGRRAWPRPGSGSNPPDSAPARCTWWTRSQGGSRRPSPSLAAGSPTIDLSAGVVYLPVMSMPRTGVIATGVLPIGIDSLAQDDPIPVSPGSAGTMLLAVDPTTGQVWVAADGAVTVLE